MNMHPQPSRLWLLRLGTALVMLLVLAGIFAWYFVGPVPFDLNRLWAFCTGL